jgi:peptidoglycan/LPS O-acetylase OafA/YrhL
LIYTAGAIAPEFSHSGRFSSVCAVLSVLLALPLYRWVTLPIDRWRDQRNTEAMRASRRSLAQNPIAGIAAPATD